VIYSVNIVDPGATPVMWLDKVPTLKEPREFVFSPGLNILWGRNGSGKSTLLKLLAMIFHCEQGGYPVLTQTSVGDLCERMRFKDQVGEKLRSSVAIKHDGQGVRFFNPSQAVGLTAGGAAFDGDFMHEGMMNVMRKASAGQTTMARFNKFGDDLLYNRPAPEVEDKLKGVFYNDLWEEWLTIARDFLKGNAKKGPSTILLDEPERSVDLPLQVQCWRIMRAQAKRGQLIVASHSLFALNIPEANYIEMEANYMGLAKKCLALLPEWAKEDPAFPDKLPEPEPVKKPAKKRGQQT
jgi:predicted ATPase